MLDFAAPVWTSSAPVEIQGGTTATEPLSSSKFSNFQLQ
jgi:hypothetical protein